MDCVYKIILHGTIQRNAENKCAANTYFFHFIDPFYMIKKVAFNDSRNECKASASFQLSSKTEQLWMFDMEILIQLAQYQ